jgi:hypothetical protein
MPKLPRHLSLAVIALAMTATAAPAQASDPPPSLRLIAPQDKVKLHSFRGRAPLHLDLRVAAAGGAFQLNVRRPDYGEWTIDQVDPQTGDVLRSLPTDALTRGLPDFFKVTLEDKRGRIAARERADFCPNGRDPERIDDSGPPTSRYPRGCGRASFPFTKGTVWGIDQGWASRAFSYGRPMWVRLKPGEYEAVVRIAKPYRTAFGIGPANGRKTLAVKVKRVRGGPEPIPARHNASPGPAETRRAEPPVVTDPNPETLPDLVPGPAWHIELGRHGGPESVAFAATPWNAGPGLLDVEGFRQPGEGAMEANQYFFDADGDVVGKAPVGEFEFDRRRGHGHWHFEQFARYRLLDASQEVVLRSHKQSFCIVPTDGVDLTVPRADWQPNVRGRHGDIGSVCGDTGSLWIREALPVGWGDTYFQGVAGQAFRVRNLPDGIYYIEVEVNPTGALYEADETNNVELRKIRLGTKHGKRTVRAFPWHGIRG